MSDDNILAHYGVKGMRWGRHKNRLTRKELNAPNERYSAEQRKRDSAQNFLRTSGSERAINRRMNRGDTLLLARKKETRINAIKSALSLTVAAAGIYAMHNPDKIVAGLEKLGAFTTRMSNLATQQGIGPGYEVAQMILKNGTWVLK